MPLTVSAAGVLANDAPSFYGQSLTAQVYSSPSHGSLALNPDGSFVYLPNAGYTGADSFQYVAHSSSGANSAPATVNLSSGIRIDLEIGNPAGKNAVSVRSRGVWSGRVE